MPVLLRSHLRNRNHNTAQSPLHVLYPVVLFSCALALALVAGEGVAGKLTQGGALLYLGAAIAYVKHRKNGSKTQKHQVFWNTRLFKAVAWGGLMCVTAAVAWDLLQMEFVAMFAALNVR